MLKGQYKEGINTRIYRQSWDSPGFIPVLNGKFMCGLCKCIYNIAQ